MAVVKPVKYLICAVHLSETKHVILSAEEMFQLATTVQYHLVMLLAFQYISLCHFNILPIPFPYSFCLSIVICCTTNITCSWHYFLSSLKRDLVLFKNHWSCFYLLLWITALHKTIGWAIVKAAATPLTPVVLNIFWYFFKVDILYDLMECFGHVFVFYHVLVSRYLYLYTCIFH